MPNETRVVSYLRVSRQDQQISNQRPDLLRMMQSHEGWKLTREYSDEGVSGSKDRRPGLDRLMADARAHCFDVVAVWRFDRLFRSIGHCVRMLEEFKQLNIRFVSCQENIDLGTPLGEAMFVIIGALNSMELSVLKTRIRAGLARARAEGVKLGRPRLEVSHDRVREVYQSTCPRSVRVAARLLGVSRGYVHDVIKGCTQNVSIPADVVSSE